MTYTKDLDNENDISNDQEATTAVPVSHSLQEHFLSLGLKRVLESIAPNSLYTSGSACQLNYMFVQKKVTSRPVN